MIFLQLFALFLQFSWDFDSNRKKLRTESFIFDESLSHLKVTFFDSFRAIFAKNIKLKMVQKLSFRNSVKNVLQGTLLNPNFSYVSPNIVILT